MKRSLPLACALALGCAAPQQPAPANMLEADKLLRGASNRTGNLRIDCSPDDAIVAIDGLPVGLCSDFKGQRGVELKKGTRRLAVNKSGYLPYESIVDTDGTRVSLSISLAPASL
jgi:hypothetical protein